MAPAPGLDRLFPTPEVLVCADLTSIGLPLERAMMVRSIAQAMVDGRADFNSDRTLDDFVARWTSVPGISAWTAQYLALRALGHPDAFPVDGFVASRIEEPNDNVLDSTRALETADSWRPWRGYAAIHLWRTAGAA
jgi:AraC family transcriptional regulator, regulatory protein of adaptative response / DNA-3-methyladenine glycosylase II